MSGSPTDVNTIASRIFRDRFHVAQQQRTSRLRGLCQVLPFTAGKTMAYDGIGLVDATEITGSRYNLADFSYAPYTRRKIGKRRFFLNLPIDRSDAANQVIAPESPLIAVCVRAANRVFDRVVLDSAFAAVLTGEEFGTSVTAANDGVSTVDATTGVVYDKILELNANFKGTEANTDMGRMPYLVITEEEEKALMQEAELTSGDFVRHFPIEKGQLVSAVGNNLIIYGSNVASPMLGVAAGTRSNVAFLGGAEDPAFCVGMALDIAPAIEKRTDYVGVKQVIVEIELGAVRTEGKLVQKFNSTDA